MGNPNVDPRLGQGRDIPDRNRDPGADLESEGIPEVADDSAPGTGEVPEPEQPVAPTDMPTASTGYGTTAWEQGHPRRLDARLAEEIDEDDPTEDFARDDRPAERAALRVDEDPWSDDELEWSDDAAQVSDDAAQVSDDAAQVSDDAAQVSDDAAQVSDDAAQVSDDER